MSQPPGFTDPRYPNHVCKLHKALYGLKQAPRAWFEKLSSKLLELNFVPSKSDTSLFIRNFDGHITIIFVYVDDFIVTVSSNEFIASLVLQLSNAFAVKDLGKLHYFLGVEVHYQPTITIHTRTPCSCQYRWCKANWYTYGHMTSIVSTWEFTVFGSIIVSQLDRSSSIYNHHASRCVIHCQQITSIHA